MKELLRAAMRTCDAATRAFEAMADYYDEVSGHITASHDAVKRNHESGVLANDAYVAAEKARESAWISGNVSGSVVEFHGANK